MIDRVIFYGIRAVRNTRSDVKVWSRATLWNPANVLLRQELLTPEGLRYRRRCLGALIVFAAFVMLPFMIGMIIAALK